MQWHPWQKDKNTGVKARTSVMPLENVRGSSRVLIATTNQKCLNEDVGQLLDQYAVGALSEPEELEFEDHLNHCRHCQFDLINIDAVAVAFESLRAETMS